MSADELVAAWLKGNKILVAKELKKENDFAHFVWELKTNEMLSYTERFLLVAELVQLRFTNT